jgi:hypothetical protein
MREARLERAAFVRPEQPQVASDISRQDSGKALELSFFEAGYTT